MLLTSLLASQKIMTLEEYLKFEENSQERHEFHAGKLYIMSGGTYNHSRICITIARLLDDFCENSKENLEVFASDMKVVSTELGRTFYPDVSIVKGTPHSPISTSKSVYENPCCLIEVLSKSTAKYDAIEKFDCYKTLPSFREYVLIDQYQKLVEVRTLEDVERNLWDIKTFRADEDVVSLKSIGFEATIKEIYKRVQFSEEEEK